MHHLFLPADQFSAETARIRGSDHLHLARVLRARPGETLILLDNAGSAYRAVIESVGKTETIARLSERVAMPSEPPVKIVAAQALGKGDKFEQVIQHGTEAGASAFIPVKADRCVVDIPPAKAAERLARWRQIAKGAAEQSRRARVPEVLAPMSFAELLRSVTSETTALLLHPESDPVPLRAALTASPPPQTLLFAIGPEGGWSPAEVSAARLANVLPVTLGPRILRTETAALIAISQALFHYENLQADP